MKSAYSWRSVASGSCSLSIVLAVNGPYRMRRKDGLGNPPGTSVRGFKSWDDGDVGTVADMFFPP